MSFLALLAAVAPVFVVVLTGFAIRRAGWLTPEADVSLLRMAVNLLFPCLILLSILGNVALEHSATVIVAPAIGFCSVAGGYAISYWAAPWFGIAEPGVRRSFAFTAGIFNYVYLPLPIVQQLFSPETTGVLFLHNVGAELALWTVGVLMLTGASPRQGWRRLLSVPLLAILTALLLNFCGAGHWMPKFLLAAVRSLSGAATPLALLLTGAAFADRWRDSEAPAAKGAISLGACVLRIGLLPILMLAAAWSLPVAPELRHVMIVEAAMPAAVFPVMLAHHYGADAATSFRVVLATSLLGLLTIPLWLRAGMLIGGG